MFNKCSMLLFVNCCFLLMLLQVFVCVVMFAAVFAVSGAVPFASCCCLLSGLELFLFVCLCVLVCFFCLFCLLLSDVCLLCCLIVFRLLMWGFALLFGLLLLFAYDHVFLIASLLCYVFAVVAVWFDCFCYCVCGFRVGLFSPFVCLSVLFVVVCVCCVLCLLLWLVV